MGMAAPRAACTRTRFFAWLMTIFAAAALAGCGGGAPVTVVQSKKDENYTAKLQRVLIVRNFEAGGGMSEINMNGYMRLNEIQAAFDAKVAVPHAVHADYVDITQLSRVVLPDVRREPAVAQAMATLRPTHVLDLRTGSVQSGGSVRRYTIDARLYDTASGKIVWRSLIAIDNMAGRLIRAGDRLAPSHQGEANLFVDALRSQLEGAGLL
jgi:hypothetical protein